MPLALIAIAWLIIMTGINGNYTAVGTAFEQDVLNNGQGGGFLSFLAGIVGIAVFFRVIDMPNAGRVFLVLVILVFVMRNAGVLTALENIGGAPTTAAASTALPTGAINAAPFQAASSFANSILSAVQGPSGGAPTVGSNPGDSTPLTTPAGSGGIGSA